MKVKVNRTTIDLFEGALVRHALLRYFVKRKYDLKLVEQTPVFDAYGHGLDLDAPLHEGMTIKCKVR